MKPRLRYALVVPLLAPAAWLACNALAGIDEPIVQENTCVLAAPPSPPAPVTGLTDSGSVESDAGLLFAFSKVEFGRELLDGAIVSAAPSYDLDEKCTCPGLSSCKPIVESDGGLCDLDRGRDNGFLSLYRSYGALLSLDSINVGLQSGEFGFLLKIDGYNGSPNDPVVQVTFISAGQETRHPLGMHPSWDGTDAWYLDRMSFDDAGAPRMIDTSAYVTDGVLVSRMPIVDLVFPVFSEALRFEVREAMVTARIGFGDAGLLTLTEGQFIGRIPVESLLQEISRMQMPPPDPNCTSPQKYGLVRTTICGLLDIQRKSGTSTEAPCDALSFALAFEAIIAKVGPVQDVPKKDAAVCPDGMVYNCDNL